tara:strand:- start:24 stop:533 length:510 start_codon:yes stop_codon:yes gene_type:complete
MDQNIENKSEYKNRLINFYDNNKIKIYSTILLVLISLLTFIFILQIKEKKNILIAEKYVEAGLLMSSNQKENAIALYEEIILSKNSFYSVLSLNKIIEKSLIVDENKILNYFKILEKSAATRENKDLIFLKKALYLVKISNTKAANDILKNLIEKNSNFKSIAQELIKK